jgi:cytochrome c oxidase subunit II
MDLRCERGQVALTLLRTRTYAQRSLLRGTAARARLLFSAVLALSFLLTACEVNPQTAFNPRSDYADEGLSLFQLTIVAGVVVGVLVEAILVYAAIRYRRRALDRLPPQIHGNTLIEILWTTGPVLIVAYILVVTLPVIFNTQAPAPSNSMLVKVIGHQFWWEFQYPDANVITANELHLPLGRTANLELLSNDVIHSFWIPALGGKRDAFPGHNNFIWMTPNSTGEFPGQCYQLCGYSHGNMRERAIIQQPGEFESWLAAQQQPAVQPSEGPAAEGAQVFQQKGCAGCHTIQGTSAAGAVGPNLTHFASRGVLAGSVFERTDDNLRRWLKDPPKEKPGSIMPNLGLNDHELDVLVAYLQSLK